MNRYVSFGLLVAVILILAFLFYKVMVGFFVPLFLAALLVVIFRPIHVWYLEKCKNKQKLAALLTTVSILVVVMLPLAILMLLAVAEGRQMIRKMDFRKIGEQVVEFRTNFELGLTANDEFQDVEESLAQSATAIESEDLEGVRTHLRRLVREGETLAAVLELTWPEPVPLGDGHPEFDEVQSNDDAWRRFALQVQQARLAVDDLGAETLQPQQLGQQLAVVDERLSNAESTYLEFKKVFVGKQTWIWVRDLVRPLGSELASVGGATTAFVLNFVFGAAIMIISLYFFLLDGPAMINSLKGLSPLDDEHEDELISEFDRVSRAVVVATLLSAGVQGILASIGFYFAGVESVFLLMLITSVFALIPFVGAAAVWVPVSLWLFFVDDRHVAGILLAIYGAGVVSLADNVIKPLVLHGQSNIHPLLALLSILGGVAVMGPMGILVGPMIVAFLQTMLKILQREMKKMEAGQASPSA